MIAFILIALFIFVSVVVIFGDSPTFRNTPLSKLRLLIVRYLNGFLSRYEVVNQRFDGRLSYSLGYSVPLIHILIVTFCVEQFIVKTIPILQKFSQPKYVYITLSIALIYISTYLTTFTSAGIVGYEQIPFTPNNQLIFFDDKVCTTCRLTKPARSKHCSVCNKCFALYDHHCIWVNNCIGYKNYRWFVLYLLSHINFLGYGSILCYSALRYELLNEFTEYGLWTVITSTTEANKVTGMFFILTTIFVFIVVLFFGLQMKYVYLGVTTNEAEKWAAVEHLVLLGVLYKYGDAYVEKASTRDGEVVYITMDEKVVDVIERDLVKVESVLDDLVNIYDNGFWANLLERVLV